MWTCNAFLVKQVVDRSLEVPQDVLSKEKPDSILVHFFDNWDQVSNDTTRCIAHITRSVYMLS